MNYIKAITTDRKTELFNLEKVMLITPRDNGTTKILMGAGLVWWVHTDSIMWANSFNEVIRAIDEV